MNNPPRKVLATFKEIENTFFFDSGLDALTFAQSNDLTFDSVQELPQEDDFDQMMAEIVSEEEYIRHEEMKDQKMMEEREEEPCPLCDTYHDDWDNCFHIREEY